MNERQAIIMLQHIYGLGPAVYKIMADNYTSIVQAILAPCAELEELGIRKSIVQEIKATYQDRKNILIEIYKNMQKHNLQILTIIDEQYPEILREIHDPPLVLYCNGNTDVLHSNTLAVVGMREPSFYGKWAATELGEFLAENDVVVASGLARGIDKHVHEGAVSKKGRCIAVVATGLDIVYPSSNRKLHDAIIANGGCIVSEYAPGTEALPGHFPARNRIISGLSVGVVVVESKASGGALITADQALEQNREVFALPGNINTQHSKGTNNLLRQGARMICDWSDIFEELPFLQKKIENQAESNIKDIKLSESEKNLCSIVAFEPMHIDDIVAMCTEQNIHLDLMQLQIKKVIVALPGQYYVRLR